MKVKKVKSDDKMVLIELVGETFTLANSLREELWEDSAVLEAAQIREHPYLSEPKIFVRVSRGLPTTALERAAKRLLAKVEEFEKRFRSALKSHS